MPPPLTIALANSGRHWIGEVAHVAMLYTEFEALGHRPWIIARRGGALEAEAQRHGWRLLALGFGSRLRPLHDAADLARWVRWAGREKADVIHCHRGKDHWMGVGVALLAGRPLVRTRHVVLPVQPHALNHWLYLQRTQAVICVSMATRRGFGVWQDRLPAGGPVILSAVDGRRFTPERRSAALRTDWAGSVAPVPPGEEPLWFGLVGRLQRIKGHRYFIDAASEMAPHCPNARFWIAGMGLPERREDLHLRARQRGIGDKLITFAKIENLPEALASLDVGVIASIGSEGSSRVALEMMSSGLPLIATEVGGIPDLAGPAGGTRLVKPFDPPALAAAMRALARDAAERARAGNANREWTQAHHQPRAWAEAVLSVYGAARRR